MSFRVPRFLGALGAGDPPNLTAALVAASQVLECGALCSFFFELVTEVFQRAVPSPMGAKSSVKLSRPLALAQAQTPASARPLSVLCSSQELFK